MNPTKLARQMMGYVFALTLLTGCGNSDSAADSISIIPEGWETFTSSRYNYSIAHPTTWDVSSLDGDWEGGRALLRPYEAGYDSFTATDSEQSVSIVLGVQPIPNGTSLKKWSAARTEEFVSQYGPWCGEPESRESVAIGGAPAITMTHHCTDGLFLIYIYAVHGAQGFGLVWRSQQGNEKSDQAMFDKFIASFAFKD